jgi:hypothetical protein
VDIASVAPTLGLLSQFGSGKPALVPGQVIQAVVLALLEDGSVRLALPDATIDVRSAIPLAVGTPVRLVVQSTGSGLQLVLSPEGPIGSSAVSTQAETPSVPGAGVAAAQTTEVAAGAASVEEPAVKISIQTPNPAAQAVAVEQPPAQAPNVSEAVVSAVRIAAARQGGLAPLIADVQQLVSADTTEVPAAVLKAAAQLLSLRLPLEETGLTAAAIKQALSQSGLFLEARLAPLPAETANAPSSGVPGDHDVAMTTPASAPPEPTPQLLKPDVTSSQPLSVAELASPATDMKAALLVLRQVVGLWAEQASSAPPHSLATAATPAVVEATLVASGEPEIGQGPVPSLGPIPSDALPPSSLPAPPSPPEQPLSSALPPPPPYRGSTPTAQPAAVAALGTRPSPAEAAQRLFGETDAALARHTLFQVASLPDHGSPMSRIQTQGPQWTFEVPLMTPAGTSIAQFEVGRDGGAASAESAAIWHARFAVDIEPMGPVQAQVTLRGNRAAVTLWAERDHSAARLRENSAQLVEALKQAELEPGDILCRTGTPPVPPKSLARAGRFLDRAS